MKKIIAMMAFIALLVMNGSVGLGEAQAKYTARTNTEFHLRAEPDGRWVTSVPKGSSIDILEWAEDWCLASYQGMTGYCKTSWTYSLSALDPLQYPLPGNPYQVAGVAILNQDTQIKAGKYRGTIVAAGEAVCSELGSDGSCVLPVWRDRQVLAAEEAVFQPFIAWDAAAPGDLVGGFTTYYSDQQGKQRPKERLHNILLGCERVDDYVLASGETFSFNAVCGPYLKSNGYLLGPNISSDGVGYGGGVCQVSTTLYNALLTLPIRIEEWCIHRHKGVDYVAQFFDASVGIYSDLVFTNSLPYPIRLRASAENGVVNLFIFRAE